MTTGRILTWLHGHIAPRRSLELAAACLAAVCAWALPAASAFAEGSVDFNTGADTRFRNYLEQYGAGGNYTVLRVYARAGETIQMASSVMGLAGGQDDISVYAPGTSFASSTNASAQAPFPTDPVFSTAVFDCNVDDPGTGRIASRAQELAGPAPNAGGYVACEFTAPSDGIYPVVMIPYDPVTATFGTGRVGTPGTTTTQAHAISMWDVTVRAVGGAVQPGRLFANRLTLAEGSGLTPANAPNPVAYLYTPAGYQYRVSFFAHNGASWFMAADGKGVVDAASGQRLFASFDTTGGGQAIAPLVVGGPDLALDARYPIFFRQPDPIAIGGPGGLAPTRGYATAPISPSSALTSLAFTGARGEQGATARGSGGTIRFSSPAQMAGLGYTVAIDVNGNGTFGDANDFVDSASNLAGSGANAFAWNGHDANGAAPPCGATYRYQVRSTLAEVHLTQYDVENSGGTQIQRLSLPSDPALGNPLAASYNDVDPYKHAAVTNTSPSAVNDGVSGPGFHAWTGASGNDDLVDTWMRLPEAASTGSFQLGCVSDVSLKKTASAARATVGDTVTYTLTAANAGPDGAPDVTVTDTAPAQLDVRSATTTQGRCTVTGNKVSCPIGALASGASAKVTVKAVAIKAGLTTNTAVVAAPPPTVDPPANDTGKATVRVVRPTLRLTKTANRGSVRAGGTVTYTIRASNPSKRSVRNVRVCDRLPSGLVYVSSESEAKLTKSGYCWTAKTLWAGRSQTYRITVRAVAGTSGRKVNQATVNSSGANAAHASRTVRVLAARVLRGGVTG